MVAYHELFLSVSCEFLNQPLPVDFGNWSIKEVYDYIDKHKTEKFEHFEYGQLFNLITDITINVLRDIEEDLER